MEIFRGFSFPLYGEHYLEGFVVALEKSLTSSIPRDEGRRGNGV